MRRHLFYCALALLTAQAAHASDISQRTRPDWPSSYPISGAVNVANFPSTQPVIITNLPAVQAITGTITGIVTANQASISYFKSMNVSTAPLQVKIGSGEVWGFYIYNNATAGNERTIKFYDRSTSPVVGTTPTSWAITVGGRVGTPFPLPGPVPFISGLWVLATTASGDSSVAAPATGDISIWLLYR